MRFQRNFLLLLLFLSAVAAPFSAAQPYSVHPQQPQASSTNMVVLRDLGPGAVRLDGPWQFHLGDNLAWASAAIDDSHWEQLTADKPWGEQGHASYTGFAWYRLHIAVDQSKGTPSNLALMVSHIDDAYELYWNGELIGRNGSFPPHAVWYAQSLPTQTFGWPARQPGVLAMRVWKAPLTTEDDGTRGGFAAPPLAGSAQAIAAAKSEIDYQWLRSRQFVFGEDLMYALVALFGLLGWIRDRHRWTFLWMSSFALASIVRLPLYGMGIPIPRSLADGIAEVSSSVRDISLWFLLLTLLRLRDSSWLIRVTQVFSALSLSATVLDGVLNIFWWTSPNQTRILIIDAVLTGVYIVAAALPLLLVGYAFSRRFHKDLASELLAVTAFLSGMLQVIQNVAPQGSRFTHWTLSDRLAAPLLTVNGNSISIVPLAGMLLLLALVFAVYRNSLEDRRRQIAMQQEFRSAQEVQQALIPEAQENVPGFVLTSSYAPAAEVGGDFFQLIPAQGDYEGSTLVLMGDVSGKGLKAALVVALIVGAVRALAETTSSPAEVLAGINRRVCGRLQGGFVTCLVMRLDPDGACVIANAGHPPPFLNAAEMDTPGALPLGLIDGIVYRELRFEIRPEDRLSLYTDGLLEARNSGGELYGFERVNQLFAAKPSAAEAAKAAVDFGQDDDITILTLTRLEGGVVQAEPVAG